MALTDNLVAYYKLDESIGNSSAIDYVGTNTLTNHSGQFVPGKINNCANLSSTGYYTSVTTPVTGTSDWSFSVWYKSNVTGTFKYLFVFGNAGSVAKNTIAVWARNINTIVITDPGGGDLLSSVSSSTLDGNWHHLVVTKLVNVLSIYIDGNLDNSATVTGISLGTGTFNLGSDTSTSFRWSGYLDEFGVWSRALSTQEIQVLYHGGSGLQYPFGSVFMETRQMQPTMWKQG